MKLDARNAYNIICKRHGSTGLTEKELGRLRKNETSNVRKERKTIC